MAANLMVNINNWWSGVNTIKSTLKKDEDALRIGILSAARVNYAGIIDPIQTHPGAILHGIASRDRKKAQAQIDSYNLGPDCKAYGSYEDLLADRNIKAVYIPLPNGLHCEWALKAMRAGKHVLIEKPMVSNAEQARQVRETSSKTNKVALEAFHWRFHPAAHRVKSLVEGGVYGHPKSINALVNYGYMPKGNIRFNYDLAGGACMDITYVFSAITYFASADLPKCKVNVLEAVPQLSEADKRVDKAMRTTFEIEPADRAPISCSSEAILTTPPFLGFIPRLWGFEAYVAIELEKAKIHFNQFLIPTFGHSITITDESGEKQVEKVYVDGDRWGSKGKPWWTTYRYQLEAFVGMVRAKETGTSYSGPWVSLEESEKLMELIDGVYDKAALPRRGT